jgi:putative phosphoserine phosphatase/1-acylglycerol-3-phosphate O-acyltransferase
MLDVLFMLYLLPNNISFIAKESLLKVPLLGPILQWGETIPILRENLTEAKHALGVAIDKLKSGRHVAIAPEGTRRRKPSITEDDASPLLDFKKGPFHVAKSAGTRIIPVLVSGANRLGGRNLKAGTIYVNFLDPITSDFVNSNINYEQLRVHTKEIFSKNLKVRSNEEVFGKEGNNLPWILGFFGAHIALICWFFMK